MSGGGGFRGRGFVPRGHCRQGTDASGGPNSRNTGPRSRGPAATRSGRGHVGGSGSKSSSNRGARCNVSNSRTDAPNIPSGAPNFRTDGGVGNVSNRGKFNQPRGMQPRHQTQNSDNNWSGNNWSDNNNWTNDSWPENNWSGNNWSDNNSGNNWQNNETVNNWSGNNWSDNNSGNNWSDNNWSDNNSGNNWSQQRGVGPQRGYPNWRGGCSPGFNQPPPFFHNQGQNTFVPYGFPPPIATNYPPPPNFDYPPNIEQEHPNPQNLPNNEISSNSQNLTNSQNFQISQNPHKPPITQNFTIPQKESPKIEKPQKQAPHLGSEEERLQKITEAADKLKRKLSSIAKVPDALYNENEDESGALEFTTRDSDNGHRMAHRGIPELKHDPPELNLTLNDLRDIGRVDHDHTTRGTKPCNATSESIDDQEVTILEHSPVQRIPEATIDIDLGPDDDFNDCVEPTIESEVIETNKEETMVTTNCIPDQDQTSVCTTSSATIDCFASNAEIIETNYRDETIIGEKSDERDFEEETLAEERYTGDSVVVNYGENEINDGDTRNVCLSEEKVEIPVDESSHVEEKMVIHESPNEKSDNNTLVEETEVTREDAKIVINNADDSEIQNEGLSSCVESLKIQRESPETREDVEKFENSKIDEKMAGLPIELENLTSDETTETRNEQAPDNANVTEDKREIEVSTTEIKDIGVISDDQTDANARETIKQTSDETEISQESHDETEIREESERAIVYENIEQHGEEITSEMDNVVSTDEPSRDKNMTFVSPLEATSTNLQHDASEESREETSSVTRNDNESVDTCDNSKISETQQNPCTSKSPNDAINESTQNDEATRQVPDEITEKIVIDKNNAESPMMEKEIIARGEIEKSENTRREIDKSDSTLKEIEKSENTRREIDKSESTRREIENTESTRREIEKTESTRREIEKSKSTRKEIEKSDSNRSDKTRTRKESKSKSNERDETGNKASISVKKEFQALDKIDKKSATESTRDNKKSKDRQDSQRENSTESKIRDNKKSKERQDFQQDNLTDAKIRDSKKIDDHQRETPTDGNNRERRKLAVKMPLDAVTARGRKPIIADTTAKPSSVDFHANDSKSTLDTASPNAFNQRGNSTGTFAMMNYGISSGAAGRTNDEVSSPPVLFDPKQPPPNIHGIQDIAEPQLPPAFDPRLSSHQRSALLTSAIPIGQDFTMTQGYPPCTITSLAANVPAMNYVVPTAVPPPATIMSNAIEPTSNIPPICMSNPYVPLLPIPNVPIVSPLVLPNDLLLQPPLPIKPPLPPLPPVKSTLDMNAELEDMQEAMEFAKQFMNMNENVETNRDNEILDPDMSDESDFFHMPTFPDLPPIELPPMPPVDEKPMEIIVFTTGQQSCGRENAKKIASKSTRQEIVTYGPAPMPEEYCNSPGQTDIIEDSVGINDEQLRPKVVFNLSSKTKKISKHEEWHLQHQRDDEHETAHPSALPMTISSGESAKNRKNKIVTGQTAPQIVGTSKEKLRVTNGHEERKRRDEKTSSRYNGRIGQSSPSSSQSNRRTDEKKSSRSPTPPRHGKYSKNIKQEDQHTRHVETDKNVIFAKRSSNKESSAARKSNESRTPESTWKSRVIGRFLKMSKNDIGNMLNNASLRKFDIAMKHLVKERRSSLSLEMRSNEEERMRDAEATYNREEFMDQLSAMLDPSATVDVSNLPTQFIHHLSEVLQLDRMSEFEMPLSATSGIIADVSTALTQPSPSSETRRAPPETRDSANTRQIDEQQQQQRQKQQQQQQQQLQQQQQQQQQRVRTRVREKKPSDAMEGIASSTTCPPTSTTTVKREVASTCEKTIVEAPKCGDPSSDNIATENVSNRPTVVTRPRRRRLRTTIVDQQATATINNGTVVDNDQSSLNMADLDDIFSAGIARAKKKTIDTTSVRATKRDDNQRQNDETRIIEKNIVPVVKDPSVDRVERAVVELDEIFTAGIARAKLASKKAAEAAKAAEADDGDDDDDERPWNNNDLRSNLDSHRLRQKSSSSARHSAKNEKWSRRKNREEPVAFRNLTKEEWEAKYGESSYSSYQREYRAMEAMRAQKSQQRSPASGKQDFVTPESSEIGSVKSRLGEPVSGNQEFYETWSGSDDRARLRNIDETMNYPINYDRGNDDSSSTTSTSSDSSDKDEDETAPSVTKLLKVIKEREKIAKQKSLNEEIRDEVTAEIERKRRERDKVRKRHKARTKKSSHHHHRKREKKDKVRDKKRRERKRRKRKSRRSGDNSRESSDNEDADEEYTSSASRGRYSQRLLNEDEIKKEIVIKEEPDAPTAVTTIEKIRPKSSMNVRPIDDSRPASTASSSSVPSIVATSMASLPLTTTNQPKTKAQLKQMPADITEKLTAVTRINKETAVNNQETRVNDEVRENIGKISVSTVSTEIPIIPNESEKITIANVTNIAAPLVSAQQSSTTSEDTSLKSNSKKLDIKTYKERARQRQNKDDEKIRLITENPSSLTQNLLNIPLTRKKDADTTKDIVSEQLKDPRLPKNEEILCIPTIVDTNMIDSTTSSTLETSVPISPAKVPLSQGNIEKKISPTKLSRKKIIRKPSVTIAPVTSVEPQTTIKDVPVDVGKFAHIKSEGRKELKLREKLKRGRSRTNVESLEINIPPSQPTRLKRRKSLVDAAITKETVTLATELKIDEVPLSKNLDTTKTLESAEISDATKNLDTTKTCDESKTPETTKATTRALDTAITEDISENADVTENLDDSKISETAKASSEPENLNISPKHSPIEAITEIEPLDSLSATKEVSMVEKILTTETQLISIELPNEELPVSSINAAIPNAAPETLEYPSKRESFGGFIEKTIVRRDHVLTEAEITENSELNALESVPLNFIADSAANLTENTDIDVPTSIEVAVSPDVPPLSCVNEEFPETRDEIETSLPDPLGHTIFAVASEIVDVPVTIGLVSLENISKDETTDKIVESQKTIETVIPVISILDTLSIIDNFLIDNVETRETVPSPILVSDDITTESKETSVSVLLQKNTNDEKNERENSVVLEKETTDVTLSKHLLKNKSTMETLSSEYEALSTETETLQCIGVNVVTTKIDNPSDESEKLLTTVNEDNSLGQHTEISQVNCETSAAAAITRETRETEEELDKLESIVNEDREKNLTIQEDEKSLTTETQLISIELPNEELPVWPINAAIPSNAPETLGYPSGSKSFGGFIEKTIVRRDRVLTEAEITENSELNALESVPLNFIADSAANLTENTDIDEPTSIEVADSPDVPPLSCVNDEFPETRDEIEMSLPDPLGHTIFSVASDIVDVPVTIGLVSLENISKDETTNKIVESQETIEPVTSVTSILDTSSIIDNFLINNVETRETVPSLILVSDDITTESKETSVSVLLPKNTNEENNERENIVLEKETTDVTLSKHLLTNKSTMETLSSEDEALSTKTETLQCIGANVVTTERDNPRDEAEKLLATVKEDNSLGQHTEISQVNCETSAAAAITRETRETEEELDKLESIVNEDCEKNLTIQGDDELTTCTEMEKVSITCQEKRDIEAKSLDSHHSRTKERSHGRTKKKSSRHHNHGSKASKKTTLTEKMVDDAVAANVVKLVAKPASKDTVMARMIEIDVEIHKLMNEKMTLYKMLESGDFTSQENQDFGAKTIDETKAISEKEELGEIVQTNVIASRLVRNLTATTTTTATMTTSTTTTTTTLTATAMTTKAPEEITKKTEAKRSNSEMDEKTKKRRKSPHRETKNRSREREIVAETRGERKNLESKSRTTRITASEESSRHETASRCSREKSTSSTDLEDIEEKRRRRAIKSPIRHTSKRQNEHSSREDLAENSRDNTDRTGKFTKSFAPKREKTRKKLKPAIEPKKFEESVKKSKSDEKKFTGISSTARKTINTGIIYSDESTLDSQEPETTKITETRDKKESSAISTGLTLLEKSLKREIAESKKIKSVDKLKSNKKELRRVLLDPTILTPDEAQTGIINLLNRKNLRKKEISGSSIIKDKSTSLVATSEVSAQVWKHVSSVIDAVAKNRVEELYNDETGESPSDVGTLRSATIEDTDSRIERDDEAEEAAEEEVQEYEEEEEDDDDEDEDEEEKEIILKSLEESTDKIKNSKDYDEAETNDKLSVATKLRDSVESTVQKEEQIKPSSHEEFDNRLDSPVPSETTSMNDVPKTPQIDIVKESVKKSKSPINQDNDNSNGEIANKEKFVEEEAISVEESRSVKLRKEPGDVAEKSNDASRPTKSRSISPEYPHPWRINLNETTIETRDKQELDKSTKLRVEKARDNGCVDENSKEIRQHNETRVKENNEKIIRSRSSSSRHKKQRGKSQRDTERDKRQAREKDNRDASSRQENDNNDEKSSRRPRSASNRANKQREPPSRRSSRQSEENARSSARSKKRQHERSASRGISPREDEPSRKRTHHSHRSSSPPFGTTTPDEQRRNRGKKRKRRAEMSRELMASCKVELIDCKYTYLSPTMHPKILKKLGISRINPYVASTSARIENFPPPVSTRDETIRVRSPVISSKVEQVKDCPRNVSVDDIEEPGISEKLEISESKIVEDEQETEDKEQQEKKLEQEEPGKEETKKQELEKEEMEQKEAEKKEEEKEEEKNDKVTIQSTSVECQIVKENVDEDDEDDEDDENIQIVKVVDENLPNVEQGNEEDDVEEEMVQVSLDQAENNVDRTEMITVEEEEEEEDDDAIEEYEVIDEVTDENEENDEHEDAGKDIEVIEEKENVPTSTEKMAEPERMRDPENEDNKDGDDDDDDDIEPRRTRYTVHKGPILDIKVLDDSFLAASEDGAIYRYSQTSNGILNIYKGHEAAVTCIYVLEMPGKRWNLYSGSLDGTFRCYDITTGVQDRPANVGSPVQCMDQGWGIIYIGTKSGLISRYNIKSGSIKGDRLEFSDQSVLALKASAEGPRRVLIVASRNQPITIRDAHTGLFLRIIRGQKNHTVYSLMRERNLVYCGTSSTSIPVYDFTNGEQITQYNAGVGIVCMRLYRQILFAGCYDGNIYVFDTKEPKLLCSIPGPGNMLLSMAIVNDEIIAGSKNRQLHSWRMPKKVRALLAERT